MNEECSEPLALLGVGGLDNPGGTSCPNKSVDKNNKVIKTQSQKGNINHSQCIGAKGTDQCGFQSGFPVRDPCQNGIDKFVSIVYFCFSNLHSN